MTAPAPVTSALALAEDALLTALSALAPVGHAHWDLAPTGTVGQLMQPSGNSAYLQRVYVAQHQDGGGQRDRFLSSDGWAGLIVCRCMSASVASAQAGYVLIVGALATLSTAAGYAIHAAFDRPIAIPFADRVYTRAGQWRVTIRRIPV